MDKIKAFINHVEATELQREKLIEQFSIIGRERVYSNYIFEGLEDIFTIANKLANEAKVLGAEKHKDGTYSVNVVYERFIALTDEQYHTPCQIDTDEYSTIKRYEGICEGLTLKAMKMESIDPIIEGGAPE